MNLEQLYQEKILAFARLARQSTPLENATFSATVKNPTCGDRVRVDLEVDPDNRIARLAVVADGCALCEAASGLLLSSAPGQNATDLAALRPAIETWLKGQADETSLDGQDAFTPVKAFASRHGCVSLPFEAAAQALADTPSD